MTDNPKPVICLTRVRDGKSTYVILFDDKYWNASEWEHELILKGFTPEELGMFSFTDEELDREHE